MINTREKMQQSYRIQRKITLDPFSFLKETNIQISNKLDLQRYVIQWKRFKLDRKMIDLGHIMCAHLQIYDRIIDNTWERTRIQVYCLSLIIRGKNKTRTLNDRIGTTYMHAHVHVKIREQLSTVENWSFKLPIVVAYCCHHF